MEREMRLAVLIDAENISSKYVEMILAEANALGNVIYKRIYGNWTSTNMSSWREVILDNSIQPVQQYSNTTGKNSSDSSLIIDAMDLLFQGRLNGFCIVSSDSDFTRLAARLRESEMFVLGMGERKTPRSFISACNKFSYLDILYAASKNEQAAKPDKKTTPAKADGKKQSGAEEKPEAAAQTVQQDGSNINIVKTTVLELVEENSDDDGWIFSGKLGNLLNKRFPDFDVRNFGFKRLVPFVNSLNIVETKRDESDPKLIYFRVK